MRSVSDHDAGRVPSGASAAADERPDRDARSPDGERRRWQSSVPSGGRRAGLDVRSAPFAALAGALIVAGGLVAAVNSAAPFAHGSWLAAYLVLVGGVSQVVLGLGRLALPMPAPSARLALVQFILWNVGSLAVPAGVLTGVTGLVLLGSVILLVALACFAVGARAWPRGARARVIAYHAVILALAVSVIVGSALADAV